MAKPKPLVEAGTEYSQDREHLFRRELESMLVAFAALIDSISDGTSTNNSLYSKREHFLSPPVRVVTYDAVDGVTYS
jgi:hypothetical protein